MILMVDGAHHDEGHQKQKLHEKKTITREFLFSKMAPVHSTMSKNSKL
jgi:hypothetical protein